MLFAIIEASRRIRLYKKKKKEVYLMQEDITQQKLDFEQKRDTILQTVELTKKQSIQNTEVVIQMHQKLREAGLFLLDNRKEMEKEMIENITGFVQQMDIQIQQLESYYFQQRGKHYTLPYQIQRFDSSSYNQPSDN